MSRWSGLAPAVDAHLARWAAIDREWTGIHRAARPDGSIGVPLGRYPNTFAWAEFAKSWGVPDGDGVIQTHVIVDGETINGREQFDANTLSQGMATQLMGKERDMLRRAETHYVSREVIRRITAAALDMEPEPLFDDDLITPYGLAVLEEPIFVPDLHPETGEVTDFLRVAVRAIGWAPESVGRIAAVDDGGDAGPGVLLFIYTTRDDWTVSFQSDIVRAYERGRVTAADLNAPEGITADELRERLGPPRSMHGLARDFLWPLDVCPWRLGTPWRAGRVNMLADGVMDQTVALERQWFLTLMRFCWQRIVVTERQRLSNKASRRIELARGRPATDYSVLRLRRVDERHPQETGTGLPLGYRVLTRGHKRRVWVRSLGPARNPDGSFNEASHRLVWIDEYWRGPEGAPVGPLHKSTVIVR